eukprot:TRINITY_DN26266_c0_g1_i2.p1 TRINITY_DN26266_c0_g1~~TRINITY_DN26266_c0_g1_i2.p1  ORF type:complete len:681 (+),score=196.31 TRINITY_DN26266_c0_g1_i2:509-2551(+)
MRTCGPPGGRRCTETTADGRCPRLASLPSPSRGSRCATTRPATLHGNYSGWSMPTPGFAPESESREPMRHDAPCGVDGVGRTGWTFTKVSTDADQPAVVSLGAEAPGGVDVVVEGIAATYPVHGFMFDLPVGWNRSRYTDFVQCLRTHRWIDSNTRMVQVHLFTYNPNSNYFVQCRLFVEITAGGKLIPRAQVVPFKYERFRGAYAVFQVILNVFVAMYVVKLLADIASNVSRTGRAFLWLFSVWRLLEGFNLSIFCLSFYWKVFFWVRPFPDNDFNDPSVLSAQLADLGSFQYTLHTLTMLNALNAMLSCLKIFRFFGVHPSLKLLTETLKGVATPLLCLGAYCVTIVTAFSIAGVLIFGIHTKEYRTFANAFRTLLLALLGDFDFGELRKVDDTAAVLFFFPYMLLTWLIILNMVIAIINGGFTMAKVIQNQVGGEVDLAPKLREAWISIEQSVCCARKADGRPAVHAGPLQFNSIEGASTASIEHAIRPLLQPEVWLRAHGLGSDAVIPARAALCCTRQALAAQLAERFEAEQADRIAQGLCWLMSEGDDGSVDNRCNPEVYPALVNYRAMASVVGGGYRRKYLEQHGYGWGDDEMSASHHSSKAGARTASASGSGSGTPESMSVEDLPALAGTIPTEALLEKAVMRRQALIDALVAARARRRVSVAAEGRLGAMQR